MHPAADRNGMNSPRILVIDDEPIISTMLQEALNRKHYSVETASDGKMGLNRMKENDFDLIITDLCLPDVSGLEILKRAKRQEPDAGVILITAHSSVQTAVEAMRDGAFDYLTKTSSVSEIELTVERFFKYQSLVKENKRLRSRLGNRYGIENIIGNSPSMQRIFEAIRTVAPTDTTVLIHGASGTGKELVAQAIHDCSPRRKEPFMTTNCAALPEQLMESELFGHEKGAFTGAFKATKGLFSMADRGSILLDEVSEINISLQAKLLRVLQEKEIQKVGNPETVSVDVRILATTNRDLKEEVRLGNFRDDLYYRLNVMPIRLPLLKERREDIPLLVEYFMEKYAEHHRRDITGFDDELLQYAIDHDWPGNVRELENTIERAVIVCKTGKLKKQDLKFFDNEMPGQSQPDLDFAVPGNMTIREMERQMIMNCLREMNGNRTRAAERLGISVRTMRNKLREYRQEGLNVDDDEE
jgi:DNA-binding NtrC family response regulator